MKISKKKTLLALPIALISLELYFGVLIGYFLGRVLAGKETGESGKIKSIVFNIGRWRLHLHHWFFGLGIATSVFFLNLPFPFPQFSVGFLGGFVFQGIYCYSDWYKLLMRKKEKIQ